MTSVATPIIRVEDTDEENNVILQQQPVQNSRSGKSSKTTTTTTTTTVYKTQTTKSAQISNKDKLNKGQAEAQVSYVAKVEDLGKQAAIDSSKCVQDKFGTANKSRETHRVAKRQTETGNEANRDESVDGNRLVTTISTIAAQSGNSRIVLALLKDGDSLQLKIQEMRPGFLQVGLNYKESVKYFEEQQKLMKNLRNLNEAPVECWMKKYQKISAAKPNMSTQHRLVYICMAENLHCCWKALLNQLDKRSQLLNETCQFYESCEQVTRALDKADHHVQVFRQEFLSGPSSIKFNQASNELKVLNRDVLEEYNRARKRQQELIDLISVLGTGNLGDARINHLISDAQSLIKYISTYLEPLERRKIQLESVITTTSSTTTIDTSLTNNNNNNDNLAQSNGKHNRLFNQDQISTQVYTNDQVTSSSNSMNKTSTILREIGNFNDLNLVENWLSVKIEQLNSSLLSSLGFSISDSRSVLNKHEQIALECRAIEEATLTFNGRNIHAIKSIEPRDDKLEGDKSLFEQQKLLAVKTRDVITILEARIILLRRTIDFYVRSKDATGDIAKMMRRLQVDNSLQSVQFVSNELELKDVSSVVASGATIISELQQLQLAQQHGQRSRIVNLNLVTNGIRSIIDQLNQDLAHLKTVLNQRRLVLLNEDGAKMANNFSNKCNQLQFWLDNHVKSFLLANNRISSDPAYVRNFYESHEQLRIAVQNKTLEVEALLRSLPTLTENFDAKSKTSDDIQRSTDELRQDWINVTNCLDRRIELAKKYLAILNTVNLLNRELQSLDGFSNGRPSTPERTDEDIRSNIDQSLVQLAQQVKNFNFDAEKNSTELVYAPNSSGKSVVDDINKQQLVDHITSLHQEFANKKQQLMDTIDTKRASNGLKPDPPAHQRPQQVDPPRFTRILTDQVVEPFSTVDLECETDDADCQVEWFMNNFKKIPAAIKHSASSENNQHKLTISNFSSICCGTYMARASNGAGHAITGCKMRLSGIKEAHEEPQQMLSSKQQEDTNQTRRQTSNTSAFKTTSNFQSSSPAISTTSSFSQWRPNGGEKQSQSQADTSTTTTQVNEKTISRIIRGVDSSEPESPQTVRITQVTSDSDTDATTTTTRDRNGPAFPVTKVSYSGPSTNGTSNSINRAGNHLRVSYNVDSPVSSTTIDSRSVSKSPFEGTPQPPLFVQNLQDTMPRCCSRAGLVCLVVGNPPPTIEWMHNNATIATTKCPRSTTCPRGNICKLTIETMNNQTQGKYVCRASNRLGQTSTGITLTK